MSDPRQLAEDAIAYWSGVGYAIEHPHAGLGTGTTAHREAVSPLALARELLSALDALEAANKELAGLRESEAEWQRRGDRANRAEAERDRLAEALRRYANEAPGWFKHIALDALAGGGHEEPEQQKEQDLGGTAVAVPSSKSAEA